MAKDSTFAQSTTKPNSVTLWLSAGLGGSSLGSLAGSISLSGRYGIGLVSLRGTANSEKFELFLESDEFFDAALLVGIGVGPSKKGAIGSVAIGVAEVTGSRFEGEPGLFGSGENVEINPTIGFAIEVQLFGILSDIFGLGCMGI